MHCSPILVFLLVPCHIKNSYLPWYVICLIESETWNFLLLFFLQCDRKERTVESYWEPNQTLQSVIISVRGFLFAGWTQPWSAFHTICSFHHRMLCSLFNSILPQSPHMTSVVIYTYFCGVELLILSFYTHDRLCCMIGVSSWQMCICVCDDSLILLPSCMISLPTVLTTSPLVIWWTTPVCSAGSLWCQQVPWDWRDR